MEATVMEPKVQTIPTGTIISQMFQAAKHASDLILSPHQAPHARMNGKLAAVKIPGIEKLTAEDTARIASDLIGSNDLAKRRLKEEGSCDVSYSIPKLARFRVNIFMQRGTYAIVMRAIATSIPDLASLHLPAQLAQIAELKTGVVLVTGATGSGKSSTLAALLNLINEKMPYHIVTIEDPIEFTHSHKKSIIHQRELYMDTPRFDLALRAALRQSPDVILVGEMRDRETIEIVLEAAETGHLVFSTLHTIDASSTVERIIGTFPLGDQQAIRNRLAKSFRYIISQRLIPRKDNAGRIALIEILKSTLRTQQYIAKGDGEGRTLLDAMRDGSTEGMQHFDGEIERLVREGVVDFEVGIHSATNPGNLTLELADFLDTPEPPQPETVVQESELEIERF
jgi:twitching motility protein PilT